MCSGTRTHSPAREGPGGQWGVGQPSPPPHHGHHHSSQAYPPEPHQNPVGLGPGPLLIGSQEAPHHGNTPVRARGGGQGVRPGMVRCGAGRVPPCPDPHSLLLRDPLHSAQGVWVAHVAGQRLHQRVTDVCWDRPCLSRCLAWALAPTPQSHLAGILSRKQPARGLSHPGPPSPLQGPSPVPTMRVSAKCLARMAARRVRVSS